MKRDMDIVRELLAVVECQAAGDHINGIPKIGEASAETVAEHVRIMKDANLLYADVMGSAEQGYAILIFGLTWKGHDFLESIRNDSVWKKVKGKILGVGGGMTIDLVKELATSYLREMLQVK